MRRIARALGRLVGRVLLHERFFPACFALALLVRLIWIGVVHTQPTSDFAWYYTKGQQIASGQGYVVTDDGFPLWNPGKPLEVPRPTAFWPVGYPAFLGGLFWSTAGLIEPLWAAKLANALLYTGLIAAMAYCAKAVTQSTLAARATALILAFLPNHIAYTSLTAVEIYFTFLLAVGAALSIRAAAQRSVGWLFAAGLVFGLATLTKPQALFVPAGLLLVLYWRKWRLWLAHAALVYLALLLCVLPWTLRNYRVFDGRVVLVSTNGGVNLLIGNMPGSWGEQGYMWNRELEEIITTRQDEIERDVLARNVALDYIAANPGKTLLSLPKKIVALYLADVDGFGWNRAGNDALANSRMWLPLRIFSQLYYLALMAAAMAYLWRRLRNKHEHLVMALVIIAYFTAIYTVFFGGPRFHFPIVPWFAVFAGGLLAMVIESKAGTAVSRMLPLVRA